MPARIGQCAARYQTACRSMCSCKRGIFWASALANLWNWSRQEEMETLNNWLNTNSWLQNYMLTTWYQVRTDTCYVCITQKLGRIRKKCSCWVLRCSLTSQITNIALYIEREKPDKFCSEALILSWRSCTCHISTTQDQQLYFPPKEIILRIFTLWKNSSTPAMY